MSAAAVLRWGRWFIVERPGSSPRPVDLDTLLSRLDHHGADAPSRSTDELETRGDVGVEPDDVVGPIWCVAGPLSEKGIETEGADGRPFVLRAQDLRILDALSAPMTARALLDAVGCPPSALQRLVAAGKVLRGAAASSADPRQPGPKDVRRGSERVYARPTEDARHPNDAGPDGRTPVYALWHEQFGPQLGLGMVTAAARAHDGGALNRSFELRRPELLASIRSDLERRRGPAVLLLSNFVWTVDENLRAARELVALHPRLIVLHGGPSTPRYRDDVARFFSEHRGIAHVLVRGEGERTIGEVLEVIAAGADWTEHLAGIDGISYLDPSTGEAASTPDRPRITDLGALPSPYLTGEFDHIDLADSTVPMALETNRGCPYGCTYCDWGSATNSRIRSFPRARVTAEIDWSASKGVRCVMVTDANFGIYSQDMDTVEDLVRARARTGAFSTVYWHPTKNSTKRLIPILTTLREGGILSDLSIGLQTVDEATLEAVGRTNISTDRLLELARQMRQHSLPLTTDLMLGLPGQTRETYRGDLQLAFDEEMIPRTWITLSLPNSPMNDPAYKDDWGVRIGENGSVVATSSCSPRDLEMMMRLRRLFMAADVYGTLRHPLRWLQWDHRVPATDVLERISELTLEEPSSYPALTWLAECFDLHPVPLGGWTAFYAELSAFLVEEYGIDERDPALECVLTVQRALMPWPGRAYPVTVQLPHDYVSYYLDAVAARYGAVAPTHRRRTLRSHPPGELRIAGDPAEVGNRGMDLVGHPRNEYVGASYNTVTTAANELDSPLTRLLPEVARRFDPQRIRQLTAERMARTTGHGAPEREPGGPVAVSVRLGRAPADPGAAG